MLNFRYALRPIAVFALCFWMITPVGAQGGELGGVQSEVEQQGPTPTPSEAVPISLGPVPASNEAMPISIGPNVQILFTGNTRGIGMGLYPFEYIRRLRQLEDVELDETQPIHGTLAQGDFVLTTEDGRVQSVLDFLEGTHIRCDDSVSVQGLRYPSDALILQTPGPAPWIESLLLDESEEVVGFSRRVCHSSEGAEAWLYDLSNSGNLPSWLLSAFEFRQAFVGKVQQKQVSQAFMIVGQPIQEASRTFARLQSLQQLNPDAIYVDSGNFVDGTSSRGDGLLSRHRPLNFDMLQSLSPTAVVPGYNELLGGPDTIMAEGKEREIPYIASNWTSADSNYELPSYVLKTVNDGTRLAFLGVIDPTVADRIPALADFGITLTDPVKAIDEVIRKLYALEEPPDVIVCLTTGPARLLERLRRRARGVHLILGDPSFATLRVAERTVNFRTLSPVAKGAALTLPLDGIGVLNLNLDDLNDRLETVHYETSLVVGSDPVDEEVMARITKTRAELYPALDYDLIGVPGDDALRTFSVDEWNKLLCESVLQRTGGDVVALRSLGRFPSQPGVLSALWVQEHLTIPDHLQRHRVRGSALGGVLLKLYGSDIVVCGAEVGTASGKIQGRYLDNARTYELITTDRTVAGTMLGGMLGGLYSELPLDRPSQEAVLSPEGQPLPFQRAVLDGLTAQGDLGLSAQAAGETLLAANANQMSPEWAVRLEELYFTFERFQGTANDVFDAIPETLASAPSSLSLGGSADLSLEYSSENLSFDVNALADYARLEVDESESQETSDDWQLSSSISLPKYALPVADKLKFMPYGELLYDSEFTAIDEGGSASRQADLSFTLGLSANRFGSLKRLRLGAFANKDMANFDDKPLEWGGRLYQRMAFDLGETVELRWKIDLRAYGKTEADDDSDMRYRAFSEARFIFPLAHWLAAACYVQGFALKGRVPETDSWGASYMTGVALDMRGLWVP